MLLIHSRPNRCFELWTLKNSLQLQTQDSPQMIIHTDFRSPVSASTPSFSIPLPSPPPPQHLLSPSESWRIPALTESLFYRHNKLKHQWRQSLKPNTSVLSSDKPPRRARALYSHTESSGGGGACAQSAGVGGFVG